MDEASLLRLFRTDGRGGSASGSVSDCRACLLELLRALDAVVMADVSGTVGSTDWRKTLRGFLCRGVSGTGGGSIEPASPSTVPFVVPSWLPGISVMPLLVRLTLSRAANNLRALGLSS